MRILKGSTLAETLMMMLVAGIVFLSVADGLTIFTRLQTRRTRELLAAGRGADGYYRAETLLAGADSIESCWEGLALYRSGSRSQLLLRDSALLYVAGEFRDTLLRDVGSLCLYRFDAQADTVEVGIEGFNARFPVRLHPLQSYEEALKEMERGYGYEE